MQCKSKTVRIALFALAAAAAVTMTLMSCLSCEYGPSGKLSEEQIRVQEAAYWRAFFPDTEWEPQTGPGSIGETPFLKNTPLSIRIQESGGKMKARFCNGDVIIENADFSIYGAKGTLSTSHNVEYSMTFSRNPDGSSPVLAIYFVPGKPTCYSPAGDQRSDI